MASETLYPLGGKRIWVAGHRGMVGAALLRRLAAEDCEIVTAQRGEVDLRRQDQVERFMSGARPHAVILAAAKVGGILANDSRPAEFLYDNLMIEANIVEAAYRNRVEKLLFLGSSCIYPRLAPQPIPEAALLSGPLEPTNEWYAIAKISGIKLAQAYRRQYGCDFISAMPTNLYGPEDNFDLQLSHVLPALIAKAHAAKQSNADSFVVLGTGAPLREFLHVDDCADALTHLMKTCSQDEHVNVGSGEEIAIADLAALIADVVGFSGGIVFDPSGPDGSPRKLVDSSHLRTFGWKPRIGLREGIATTYAWYLRTSEQQAA
jgi:GDP-L-fucose synthase